MTAIRPAPWPFEKERQDALKRRLASWARRENGPWDEEPDAAVVEHGDVPIVLIRNGMYTWSGYVGLPPTDPLAGVELFCNDGVDAYDARGIGDATYANYSPERDAMVGLSGLWWVGFDCAHAFQLIPVHPPYSPCDEYWTIEMAADYAVKFATAATG